MNHNLALAKLNPHCTNDKELEVFCVLIFFFLGIKTFLKAISFLLESKSVLLCVKVSCLVCLKRGFSGLKIHECFQITVCTASLSES